MSLFNKLATHSLQSHQIRLKILFAKSRMLKLFFSLRMKTRIVGGMQNSNFSMTCTQSALPGSTLKYYKRINIIHFKKTNFYRTGIHNLI